MGKDHQKILQLHSTVSKLLDTLCFELCVNKKDDNCLGLLEILVWRRNNQIDDEQFVQLYRCWLQSKSVFDIFTCKQLQIYPKCELISQQLIQQNFISIGQINNALQLLNFAYNRLYLQRKPNSIQQLQQIQKIFFYLDSIGYSHLRLSSVFFLTAATIILQRLSVPVNYQFYKIHMNNLRKQLCQVQGIVSLRCFKNYFINLPSSKKQTYLQNILSIFSQIQTVINTHVIPNIFDELFNKWKNYPRFSINEMKKNLQIFRRVFQQNQSIFYDQGATLQHFIHKYSDQFVKCFQIDHALLKQFNTLLKQCLNYYIEIFCKISEKLYSRKSGNTFMTHRKKPTTQHQKQKSAHKSMREKTPTKQSKPIYQPKNKTPTKSTIREISSKKQLGSLQKLKLKTCNNIQRQITPTKIFKNIHYLHQSQTNNLSQHQNYIKAGIDKDSLYNKMMFFRNKRIQSYELVMKRLKNK